MPSFETLMAQADALINTRAGGQAKTASVADEALDDNIFKLAQELRTPTAEAQPATQGGSAVQSLAEKVAHAVAIADTLANLPVLVKLAKFEAAAKAKGFTDEQIDEVLSKQASAQVSMADALPQLFAALARQP